MFLTDTALRAIAAATGDVWPEQIWRRDIAAGDRLADLDLPAACRTLLRWWQLSGNELAALTA